MKINLRAAGRQKSVHVEGSWLISCRTIARVTGLFLAMILVWNGALMTSAMPQTACRSRTSSAMPINRYSRLFFQPLRSVTWRMVVCDNGYGGNRDQAVGMGGPPEVQKMIQTFSGPRAKTTAAIRRNRHQEVEEEFSTPVEALADIHQLVSDTQVRLDAS